MNTKFFRIIMITWMLGELASPNEDFKAVFLVKPTNVTFYLDSPRKMHQVCLLKGNNKTLNVTWTKDGKILTGNSRIKVLSPSPNSSWIFKTTNTTALHELYIDPIMREDQGQYSCNFIFNKKQHNVNFFVKISEDCRDFAFKCLPEKTCIMVSSVCDGVWDCQSGYDELTSGGGCQIPPAPQQVSVEHGFQFFKLHWKPVKNALEYKVQVESNTTGIIVSASTKYSSYKITTESRANVYTVQLAAITYAGESNWSEPMFVKARSYGIPGVPNNPRSLHQTYNSITFQWDNVDGATSYQVVYKTADGPDIAMLAFPKLPEITAHKLKENQLYMLKVRAKNELGYGEYTKPLAVKTDQIDEISQNVLVESFVNSTTVSWEIKLNNSNTLIDSYRFRYCDVDGPFQNKINSNNSYSVKENQKYNMAKCKVFKKLRTSKIVLYHLRKATRYLYQITIYGAKGPPKFVTGYFTTVMTSKAPPTGPYNPFSTDEQLLSGIVIFAIVTGALIILLTLSFLLAYACKWKPLIDAKEEYKRKREKAEQASSSQKSDTLLEDYSKV